jgi:hypothetical protein
MLSSLVAWLAHRRWLKIAAGGAVLIGLATITCRPAEHEPLPPRVAEALRAATLQTVDDTAEIHRWKRSAQAAERIEGSFRTRAQRSKTVAAHAHHHADSLARSAVHVSPVPDSVAGSWKSAYVARTAEVVALTDVTKLQDAALAQADVRSTMLDSALVRSEIRAARADSVIRLLVPVAETRIAPCKVLGVASCPSRTAVAIGSAVLTLIAVNAVRR